MKTEIAFGERLSPAGLLSTGSTRRSKHTGFLARCRYERGCEHTGFSPGAGTSAAASARVSRHTHQPFTACACVLLHAPAFCCTRLKSAKNLYLSHRFFCKIRQIHRFFCIFRQKLQILQRNQAREKLGQVTQDL